MISINNIFVFKADMNNWYRIANIQNNWEREGEGGGIYY